MTESDFKSARQKEETIENNFSLSNNAVKSVNGIKSKKSNVSSMKIANNKVENNISKEDQKREKERKYHRNFVYRIVHAAFLGLKHSFVPRVGCG